MKPTPSASNVPAAAPAAGTPAWPAAKTARMLGRKVAIAWNSCARAALSRLPKLRQAVKPVLRSASHAARHRSAARKPDTSIGEDCLRPPVRPGAVPDAVAHRPLHDKQTSLWRNIGVASLTGCSGLSWLRQARRAHTDDAFHTVLLANIQRPASAEQIGAVRQLLAGLDDQPRGRAILRAMQAHHELLGKAPEIVLGGDQAPCRPRPSLGKYTPGTVWHLDLHRLSVEPIGSAVDELAAVYNNMTGLLAGEYPFDALLRRSQPPMDARLEAAWTRWVHSATDDDTYDGPTPELREWRRQVNIGKLRMQLQEARCHGGLSRLTLEKVLRGQIVNDVPGLSVRLVSTYLDSVPPLPEDLHALNISDNPIRDWSNLPRRLKVLDAVHTGGRNLWQNLLKYLPPDLTSLDVSDNELESTPTSLRRRIKHLRVG